MPTSKKPRAKSSRADPLDNPYIADKLQKLQGVHEHSEKLMDKWHQENLEAEGRKPERVRRKARNPGPRLKQKTLKPNKLRADLLSVDEVAERLDLTERTVWNLIKRGQLCPEKIKGRTWISAAELGRYKLIFDDSYLTDAFSIVPSEYAPGFVKEVAFGRWGEPSDARLPQIELEVDLEEWWSLAIDPVATKADCEKRRQRIRDRVGPAAPEFFSVLFKINEAALSRTINQAVDSVPVPRRPIPKEDLQGDARKHLIERVLPDLRGVERNPWTYLRKAVRNYYTDCARKSNPEIAFGGPDEVEDELIRVGHRLIGGRRGELVDRQVDNDQLWRDLTRNGPDESKLKLKPRK